MSGLCGIVHFNGSPVEQPSLERMAQAAAHRGPDGIRYWCKGRAGLAHLALDITPEEQSDQQPLSEGPLALTADLRLDNRPDLISTLKAKGHLAEDRPTDVEVLEAAYRCWDTDCAEHLLGDFAFAIWDAQRRRLYAARDPMAMRPLYYRREPDRFLFASEVKQILAAPGVTSCRSESAIANHLAGRFRPLERTFYEGIRQLKPAHALVVDRAGCHTWRYWDIDPDEQIRYDDEREYAEHFRELFKDAVRCRLRAAKPVGLMLSGGLDSTSVAATAGQLLKNGESSCSSFYTYSWAFSELTQCDERSISDQVVQYYDLPATSIDAEAAAPLEQYPADTPDPDEPFAGVYDVLLRRVLDSARSDGVGRMLSGHRGDVVVGAGIYDYIGLFLSGRWCTLGRELQAHSRRRDTPLREIASRYLRSPLLKALWPKGRAAWLRQPMRRLYRTLRPASSSPSYPDWVQPEFAEHYGLSDEATPVRVPSGLRSYARRQRYRAALMPMQMRVATRFERLCARAGLAYADPWSDRRLVEFALTVPQRALSRAGDNKRLARTAMRGIIPEEARQNAGKTSPKPLYERALKERAQETVWELLTNTYAEAHGYIDEDALRTYYERYLRGEAEDHRFWYVLTLEMWLRQHKRSVSQPYRDDHKAAIGATHS